MKIEMKALILTAMLSASRQALAEGCANPKSALTDAENYYLQANQDWKKLPESGPYDRDMKLRVRIEETMHREATGLRMIVFALNWLRDAGCPGADDPFRGNAEREAESLEEALLERKAEDYYKRTGKAAPRIKEAEDYYQRTGKVAPWAARLN